MTIDDLLATVTSHIQSPQQQPTLSIPTSWTQGRTIFGGISAAMVYRAMQATLEDARPLRSFNCNFVGPLEAEKAFEIHVEVLRTGRNASQLLARAVQDDKVAVLAQACFAVDRESKISIPNGLTHSMPLPAKAKFIPQIPKITPKFLRHFDLALEEGKMPFTGSKISHTHGWMRFTQPPAAITDAHLIAMIDAWPPTVLQLLRWPAPASTMNWNIEFLHPHQPAAATDWFGYQVETRQAADGYAHTEANIWHPDGSLVALSRQTVGVFD